MFSQARRHRRCPLPPSQTNGSLALACLHWQLDAQTHVWPGDIVERLKEDHPTAHLHTVLAEAGGFADQRGKRLAQGQVQAFDQLPVPRRMLMSTVLIPRPHCVKRSAPSRKRVLMVTSLPCFFSLTNCP